MTRRYFSTFSYKRGRPKETASVSNSVRPHLSCSVEYIDRMYQNDDISLVHHLAAIYYRTLYFQAQSHLGTPNLMRLPITSLSKRFKPFRAYFTPEEEEDWYNKKNQAWIKLRETLMQDPEVSLYFIDDLILHKGLDEQFCKDGLTPQQSNMLEHALSQIAQFFGLV